MLIANNNLLHKQIFYPKYSAGVSIFSLLPTTHQSRITILKHWQIFFFCFIKSITKNCHFDTCNPRQTTFPCSYYSFSQQAPHTLHFYIILCRSFRPLANRFHLGFKTGRDADGSIYSIIDGRQSLK